MRFWLIILALVLVPSCQQARRTRHKLTRQFPRSTNRSTVDYAGLYVTLKDLKWVDDQLSVTLSLFQREDREFAVFGTSYMPCSFFDRKGTPMGSQPFYVDPDDDWQYRRKDTFEDTQLVNVPAHAAYVSVWLGPGLETNKVPIPARPTKADKPGRPPTKQGKPHNGPAQEAVRPAAGP